MSSLTKVKKFEQLGFNQWIALGIKLGGLERTLEVLSDKKIIILQDRPESFFDDQGRAIPLLDLKEQVVEPDPQYELTKPNFSERKLFAGALDQFDRYFKGFSITAEQFVFKIEKLISQIKNKKTLRNLLKGVCLPICLPGLNKNGFDYGSEMVRFLSLLEKFWKDKYKENEIRSWHGLDKLEKDITVLDTSCHQELIIKMMMAEIKREPVVAIYFPSSFMGFPFQASRDQMRVLPKGLLLSGAFDTITAMIMHSDILLRSMYTPALYLAALKHKKEPEDCLWFNLGYGGKEILFNRDGNFKKKDLSYSHSSSGLLYIGTEEDC